jgi:hypothetical protein
VAATLLAVIALVPGCLGKPEIEDRWTRVDVVSSSLTPNQVLAPGTVPVTVSTTITYRGILTGFAVAELRASSSVNSSDVSIHPDGERVPMASDIDRLLQGSVTMGRATRAITGWDHLVQPIDFTFAGNVPASMDSTGAAPSLYLLCYLGSGTEIELADGSDSLVVTPFPSTQYEVLPVGMELRVGQP